MSKVVCDECYWCGDESEMLTAPNPFESGTINGCPHCLSVESLVLACEEPGCKLPVSCGTPMLDGSYRSTCGKHMPRSRDSKISNPL